MITKVKSCFYSRLFMIPNSDSRIMTSELNIKNLIKQENVHSDNEFLISTFLIKERYVSSPRK